MRYTTRYARTHLSRLIREAEAGEEVVVMRGSKPIVKIIPTSASTVKNESHSGEGATHLESNPES
jgi:antitoxin (DNA-binding transcriptional repressor) of toxin-antitoxin stability system